MNIKLDDIRLSYSYKTVLNGVTLGFQAGRIHALLGENGAGKSSLVKILTGAVRPTGGKILLDNDEVVFKKPSDSLKRGIACVHQRPFLADSLTVRENLRIGIKNQSEVIANVLGGDFPKLDYQFDDDQKLNDMSQFYICGTEIKFDKKASALSGSERFFVAFSSALLRNPKILILDEPTVHLNTRQSESLFVRLRSLSDSGVNVIIITHKESDLKYCDDKIFINEGKVTAPKQLTSTELENDSDNDNINSEVSTLNFRFTDADLKKYRKMGNVGIIPTNKTYLASNPNLTIAQVLYPAVKKAMQTQKNAVKKHIGSFTDSGKSSDGNVKTENEIMLEIIKKAGINIRPEEKAFNLSGGMLQRLILERELWNNPETIVLENPYQGLDNASCQQLKKRFYELEKRGVHIIE